jgi:hypothetical protein
MNTITGVAEAIVGLVLLCFAETLSLRYNAWTTSFRTRHPNINPPPTPGRQIKNTKIMTILFRICGAVFLLTSCLYFLPLLEGRLH